MLGFRVQAGRPTFAICDAESIDRPRDSQVAAVAAQDLARVGGIDARVEVAAYDPSWPRSFSAERKRLEALIREAEIHHIGSTAVPGMSAKPVVDIMALVADLDAPVGRLVERGGYQFPAAFNATLDDRRWLCRPSAPVRTHHLHLVSDPELLARHLRFRDRLRESAALRSEYTKLKRSLTERFPGDREAYSAGKSAVARVEASAHSTGSP